MLKTIRKNHKGFTLIEVLLVVAIISILAGIVILAINPSRQLAQSKNAQRAADVTTILNAIYQYSLDNNGSLPSSITALTADTYGTICETGGTCTGLVDLSVLSNNETYLTSIPIDPACSTANSSCYQVKRTSNNRITINAPNAENGETISVTR